jgi:hypothetical protein
MNQVLQVLGALLILVAYMASQLGWLDQRAYGYLTLNVVGSAILGVLALQNQQWGFVLLETVWALVSLWSIARRLVGAGTERSR